MTIFVTGASGHLGANVTRLLLDAGHDVRVLCRPESNNRALEGLDVERVEGDILRSHDIAQWLSGCDALLHLAATVSIRTCDALAMVEANIHGTRRLMDAAKGAGVRRVVYCSSVATIGRNGAGPSDERLFCGPLDDTMFYERTKLYAELEVMRAAATGLDVCVLNPSGLVGPHDYKPSLIGRTILDIARRKLPAYVPGSADFVPVADVARAHLSAIEHGVRGERYILSGEQLPLERILGWLAELTGAPAPRWAIPANVILPFARIKDWIESRAFPRRTPRFTAQSIRLLQQPKPLSNQRAREALRWSPGSVRDAFAAHVAWFREQGQLP